jgi:hypothetical protein
LTGVFFSRKEAKALALRGYNSLKCLALLKKEPKTVALRDFNSLIGLKKDQKQGFNVGIF